MGKQGFYLKDTKVIERLAKIDVAVFDKTGTLTTSDVGHIDYEGMELTSLEKDILKSTLRASNHPLSRSLYGLLQENDIVTLDEFHEKQGSGLEARVAERMLRVGSSSYVGTNPKDFQEDTAVYISTEEGVKGRFVLKNQYREGIAHLFSNL